MKNPNLTISKRLADGWTEQQANKQKYVCDDCGAKLWVAPDGKTIYCNALSDKHEEADGQQRLNYLKEKEQVSGLDKAERYELQELINEGVN